MNTRFLIIGVVVFLLAGAGFWYLFGRGVIEKPAPPHGEEKREAGLGAQIFEKAQNPLGERLPDTNPFSVDTNPFDAKTNPFKAEYKNPFK